MAKNFLALETGLYLVALRLEPCISIVLTVLIIIKSSHNHKEGIIKKKDLLSLLLLSYSYVYFILKIFD